MAGIPRTPFLLGLAGLIPLVWAAAITLGLFNAEMGGPDNGGYPLIVQTDGAKISIRYGSIILAFMSGVLWGFATRAKDGKANLCYALSVAPALWVFFMVSGGPADAAVNLIIGFIALLVLDWQFWRWGLTPEWWMKLRVLLTSLVVLCLVPVMIL